MNGLWSRGIPHLQRVENKSIIKRKTHDVYNCNNKKIQVSMTTLGVNSCACTFNVQEGTNSVAEILKFVGRPSTLVT